MLQDRYDESKAMFRTQKNSRLLYLEPKNGSWVSVSEPKSDGWVLLSEPKNGSWVSITEPKKIVGYYV